MANSPALFVLAMVLGYVYAFVGGFTDAANAIATSVGTRVLRPRTAVIMVGVCNLAGGLTGTAVAVTIGRGIIDTRALTMATVVAALAGAMSWSLFTYFLGIPVSETHGLIGGLVGAGVATAGLDVVRGGGLTMTAVATGLSPLLGFAGAVSVISGVYWLFRRANRTRVVPWFAWLQRASAAYMAFSHGRNDAQKPMGVLALAIAIYYGGAVTVPVWIVVSAATVAAVGTAYGGWRIIRTLGFGVTDLDPVQGFAAEVAGATVIQAASQAGIPVSTTQAITASILGVGAIRRRSAVRWGLAGQIVLSWILTIPATVLLGAVYLLAIRAVLGS